jgi:hypothetical protein
MDERVTQIRHYDFGADEFREMTQKDWDDLWAGATRIHKEVMELQALLREHGIPLPDGHHERSWGVIIR